ncbi:MAG: hypothetical protein ACTHJK_10940 [Sphingomicrobium sp.]
MAAILKRAAALPLIMFVSASALSSPGFAQAAPSTASVPATAADIKTGAPVRDSKGLQVAKIVEMQGANVVLDTGQTKIAVPMNLLARDSQGVMLTITADQFNGAIAKAHARSEAAKAAQQATPQQPQTTPPKH